MPTLARQQTLDTSLSEPYSLKRDNQLRDQLEAAALATLGNGVLSGGAVTRTTGFSAQVASGTVFLAYGMTHTLDSAQTYTAAVSGSTVYLWAKVTRTAGAGRTDADTYALSITHNTSGSAPSADHFPLAILTTDGSGITAIDSLPAGKYVQRPNAALRPQRSTILAAEEEVVPAGSQAQLFGSLTVKGTLKIGGRMRIIP